MERWREPFREGRRVSFFGIFQLKIYAAQNTISCIPNIFCCVSLTGKEFSRLVFFVSLRVGEVDTPHPHPLPTPLPGPFCSIEAIKDYIARFKTRLQTRGCLGSSEH